MDFVYPVKKAQYAGHFKVKISLWSSFIVELRFFQNIEFKSFSILDFLLI